ncbi:unnamed protein product [Mytilus edulis]|uniref:Ig-like domain-containing protein n=1 Tax=Mytilus edulis TaxID=6550 RepID=A0A8S3VSM0_MYTED|nr:unnamed protein product [Mytilus edulis]
MMCVIVLAMYSFLQLPTNSGSNLENAYAEILPSEDEGNSSLREECCPQTCITNIHEEPPLITSNFEESYYMKEEDDTPKTFQCSSSGNPAPTFQWTLNGKVLSNSLQISLNQNTGKLTITKPSIRDFGTYQCSATNKYGTAASAAFKIERAVISSFSSSVERTLPNVHQYRNVSIPCTGKRRCEPDDECRVEWKLGDGTSNTIRETERIAIDKKGTLHFLYVDLEDGSTAATPYACGINNELMRAFYKGSNVIMTILKDINRNTFKPQLLFSQDVKGLLGGDAELQCIFSGYPLPDIEWHLSGSNQQIQPSSKYQFTDPSVRRNLRIKHLNVSDEGNYVCSAINVMGAVHARIYINVTYDSNFSHKYQLSADKEILTIKNVKYPEDTSSISCETGNVIFDRNGEDSFVKSYAFAFLRVMACPSGFILTNGSNCEPCTENLYGNDCRCVCECNTCQRCDNVHGCVDIYTSSRVTTTQSTIPKFVDRNLVVYILVIACGMILMLGLFGCINIWKKRDIRQVQAINEDNRHIRVMSYTGIYDEVDALEMVDNSNINPIQRKNITDAKEEAGSSDDTNHPCHLDSEDNIRISEHYTYICPLYSENNGSTTVAPLFAIHESCRSNHTSDQSNFIFENSDDMHDSYVYEQIYDLAHEPCGYTNDSPQFIEKDNVKVEYLKPYQPLQGNWKQAPQTDADTFPLQPWTMKSKSSSDKIEENNEQEHYINGNIKFSYEDEQLYENQDDITHSMTVKSTSSSDKEESNNGQENSIHANTKFSCDDEHLYKNQDNITHSWTLKRTSSSDGQEETNDQEIYINGNIKFSCTDEHLYENEDNIPHSWTVKTASSLDNKEENNDQEIYINENMNFFDEDERLYENPNNITHFHLQLLSAEESSTNKDETIC